jgi:class 3 adenylate cyclase
MSEPPKKPPVVRNAGSLFVESFEASNLITFPIANVGGLAFLSEPDRLHMAELEGQIRTLREKVETQARKLQSVQSDASQTKTERDALDSTLKRLEEKQQIAFLLDRVSEEARSALLASEQLRSQFLDDRVAKPLYAMSVDIRRSTDLMLKAREPLAFAGFITQLCNILMDIVRKHQGVVDKFTGDGILCFFPEFFSGVDAGYLAVAAADACHKAFATHYRDSRRLFHSILSDIGLGIGIDYGACHLVQVAGTLTIVGAPVVYACRLGAAPAGTTLLNQPAYEAICASHGARVLISETKIELKHEGWLVAYTARLNPHDYKAHPPDWKSSPTVQKPAPEGHPK